MSKDSAEIALKRQVINLQIRDAELVVDGKIVGSRGGHHQLVPGLLACLLARSGDQPEFGHGCLYGNYAHSDVALMK